MKVVSLVVPKDMLLAVHSAASRDVTTVDLLAEKSVALKEPYLVVTKAESSARSETTMVDPLGLERVDRWAS